MASKPNDIRWIITGSQAYLKTCITSCYRQFSTNTKTNIIIYFVIPGLRRPRSNKTGFNRFKIIFICVKLSLNNNYLIVL